MALDQEIQALNLDQTDVLLVLDKLEEQVQERDPEFFRITEQIQHNGLAEPALTSRLAGLLETKRERVLYQTFMTIIRAQQKSLIEYKKQIDTQCQELKVLRRAIHVMVYDGAKAAV
jgi:hypothetical protein